MTIDEAVKHIEEQKDIFGGTHREFLDSVSEWLDELIFIRRWKSGVVEDFCKYDASSIDEIVHNAKNKAIDEFVDKLYQDYVYDSICRDDISFYGFGNEIKSIAEQIKI